MRFNAVPDLTLIGHLTRNLLSGCTMVLNYPLVWACTRAKCPDHDILDYRYHDAWIFLVTLLVGKVIYDSNSYIYYRLHENNTIGLKKLNLKERILRLSNNMPYRNLRMRTAIFLLQSFPKIKNEDKKILADFATYKKNLNSRIRLIRNKDICEKSGENRFFFIIKVLISYV